MMSKLKDSLLELYNEYHGYVDDDYDVIYYLYSDYYPNNIQERTSLKRILELGILSKLMSVETEHHIDEIKEDLIEYGIDKSIAVALIDFFIDILRIRIVQESNQSVEKSIPKGSLDETQEESVPVNSSKNRLRFKKIYLFVVSIILFLCVYLFVGTHCANDYVKSIINHETDHAIEIKGQILDKYPCMQSLLQWRVENKITEYIDSYNEDKTDYRTAKGIIEKLAYPAIDDYVELQLSILNDLKSSKAMFEKGIQKMDTDDYIAATKYFYEVIDSDSNYVLAQEKLLDIAEKFKYSIIYEIKNAINDNDYDTACQYAYIGSHYSEDSDLKGMKRAADYCGNPVIYNIVENMVDHLELFETKYINNRQKCESIAIFQVDNLFYLVQVGYTDDYYELSDELMDPISFNEFDEYLNSIGEIKKLELSWDINLEESEKREFLFNQFLKFGPTYTGDSTGISIIKTEPDEDIIELKKSDPMLEQAWKQLLVEAIICFVFIRILKKMFFS